MSNLGVSNTIKFESEVVKAMPVVLQKHISDWLEANDKKPEEVRYGSFPLGMVQRWIERALEAEARLNETSSITPDPGSRLPESN